MTIRSGALAVLLCLAVWSPALAQPAVAVQLPTIQIFTVDTTVSVPDSGGAYLGGIGRRQAGGGRSGLIPFRPGAGVGAGVQAGGVQARATIIDLNEWDAFVLGQAPRAAVRPPLRPDLDLALAMEPGEKGALPPDDPPQSVAEVRRRRAAGADLRHAEGREHLDKAIAAEEAGRWGAAKVYYRMAARRLEGDERAEALARMAALEGAPLAGQPAEP
jgi:hypothetical protein